MFNKLKNHMLVKKATDQASTQVKSAVSKLVDGASEEIQKQYRYGIFMAKVYMWLWFGVLLGIAVLLCMGIYFLAH